MMFWLFVMLIANAGALSISYAVQQFDLLLGHTLGIAMMFTITLLCVDQMARASK
jgi:heme A synthase